MFILVCKASRYSGTVVAVYDETIKRFLNQRGEKVLITGDDDDMPTARANAMLAPDIVTLVEFPNVKQAH